MHETIIHITYWEDNSTWKTIIGASQNICFLVVRYPLLAHLNTPLFLPLFSSKKQRYREISLYIYIYIYNLKGFFFGGVGQGGVSNFVHIFLFLCVNKNK